MVELTALDQELLNINTASPESVIEVAHELFEQEVEFLTIEGSKAEIEDLSVRAIKEILQSEKVSARDKLAGINTATELIGKKGSGVNLITAQNMQINQLGESSAKHLLSGAGKALQTLTGEVEDVESNN